MPSINFINTSALISSYHLGRLCDDVRRFHKISDTPERDIPTRLSESEIQLRCNLNMEEDREFLVALESGDEVEIVAEAVDKIYVLIGTIVQTGLADAFIYYGGEVKDYRNPLPAELGMADERCLDAVRNNHHMTLIVSSYWRTIFTLAILDSRNLLPYFHDMWKAIQVSNMAKVNPVTGKADKRADGKILKPADWKPVDKKAVFAATTESLGY